MPLKNGAPEKAYDDDELHLVDFPGRRSHEYFPELSADGKWLVWGITQRGHDHDIADYEIYLWEVGTPQESAVRLTYHSGNDRWPDIFIPSAAPALAAAVLLRRRRRVSVPRGRPARAQPAAAPAPATPPAKGKKPKHGKGSHKK